MHPVTGLLVRRDTALAELIKLIEAGQLQLKLQGGSSLSTRDRDQQLRGQSFFACSSHFAAYELDGLLTVGRQYAVGKPFTTSDDFVRASRKLIDRKRLIGAEASSNI